MEGLEAESASNALFQAGACSACGRRPSNEDQHIMLCEWSPKKGVGARAGLFGVFDGHGGPAVSILASRLLPKELHAEMGIVHDGVSSWYSAEHRRTSTERAFLAVDRQLASKMAAQDSGSTCVAALFIADEYDEQEQEQEQMRNESYHAVLANLGDSRGLVLSVGEHGDLALVGETTDHKPENPDEKRRILAADGVVTGGGFTPARVDGDLSLSRAFGDFRLKGNESLPPEQQKISPLPEICEFEMRRGQMHCGDIVVLACDGVFDVLASQDVAEIILEQVGVAGLLHDPSNVAKLVVERALREGSMDNVTCVVVQLQPK